MTAISRRRVSGELVFQDSTTGAGVETKEAIPHRVTIRRVA